MTLAGLFASGLVAEVAAGAWGLPTFLGDIGEMLVMCTAVLAFVAGILLREAAGRPQEPDRTT